MVRVFIETAGGFDTSLTPFVITQPPCITGKTESRDQKSEVRKRKRWRRFTFTYFGFSLFELN